MDLVRREVGDLVVEVAPSLGGRIHRLAFQGIDLLRTPVTPDQSRGDPWYWSGFFMAPWCNRITDGVFAFEGVQHHLPPNFDDGSAIHGQVHSRPWEVLCEGPGEPLVWRVQVEGDFPWSFAVAAQMSMTGSSVGLDLSLTNLSETPMPGGFGWHPWFSAASRLLVEIPASQRVPLDPVDDAQPRAHMSADAVFDTARQDVWGRHELYSGLGDRPVSLTWPESSIRCTIHTGDALRYVLAYAHGQTRSIAIEPQSHALGAFDRLAMGLPGSIAVLAPGASLTSTLALTISAMEEV